MWNFSGYGMFSVFETLFFLFAIIFAVVFLTILIRGIRQWHRNNQSPVLTRMVTVVSKRRHVDHHTNPVAGDITGAHGYHTTTSSIYYVTFQDESGKREEFRLSGKDYGMIAERDVGLLTSQGTRFRKFERKV